MWYPRVPEPNEHCCGAVCLNYADPWLTKINKGGGVGNYVQGWVSLEMMADNEVKTKYSCDTVIVSQERVVLTPRRSFAWVCGEAHTLS